MLILRGGRDAINSNKALVTVARKALENAVSQQMPFSWLKTPLMR